MTDQAAPWDLPGLRQSSTTDWDSASATQPQSPNASDEESIDAWFSPTQSKHKAAVSIPLLAIPSVQPSQHTKHLRFDTGQLPPNTPDPSETGAAAPGLTKPPRHSSRQHKPAGPTHLSFVSSPRVPVSWIGDSTDHADYRPANTSYTNHEADTIKVASFVNAAKQVDAQAGQQQPASKQKRRKWRKWSLLGAAAAGVLVGAAFKLFGDYIDLDTLPLQRSLQKLPMHRPQHKQTPSTPVLTTDREVQQLLCLAIVCARMSFEIVMSMP